MRLTMRILLIIFCLAALTFGQNSAGYYYEDGKIKIMDPSANYIANSFIESRNNTDQPIFRKILSSKFSLLFSEEEVDAFYPGYNLFCHSSGFAAMDEGNGKKMFVTSRLDTATESMITKYYSSGSYSVLEAHVEPNLGLIDRFMETASFQITGDNSLEHLLHFGYKTEPPQGSTIIRVRTSPTGNTLFTGAYSEERRGFFVADQFRKERDVFDLTGNNFYEMISYKPIGFLLGTRIYVYDNLTVVDSIDDSRASFFNKMSTTHDINSDGLPEICNSVDNSINFYQWNSSSSKFQLLGNIPSAPFMLRDPANVDGDNENEIIVQSGILGDSIVIYSPNFVVKYRFKSASTPGYGISRYFAENVNETPNKEIVLVSSFYNMSQLWQSKGTIIYDLGINSTAPIFIDSTFETLAVGDLKGDGTTYFLGMRAFRNENYAIPKNQLELRKFTSSGFQTLLTLADTTLNYVEITGPLTPPDYLVNTLLGGAPRILSKADMNNDGKNDFIIRTRNMENNESLYLIIDSDGNLIDTLPSLQNSLSVFSFALCYDFNNNGKAEILLTQSDPFNFVSGFTSAAYLFEYEGATGVSDKSAKPGDFILSQNYPNPFNPSTKIKYAVSGSQLIKIKVYDILGNEIATLVNEEKQPGHYEVQFDGLHLSSGVYFYTLQSGKKFLSKKMSLIK